MNRTKYIYLAMGAGLLILLGMPFYANHALGSLEYEILDQRLSPDSFWKVIVYDCHIANGGHTGVSIIRNSDKTKYEILQQGLIYSTQNQVSISTHWASPTQLNVSIVGPKQLEIKRSTSFAHIAITYS